MLDGGAGNDRLEAGSGHDRLYGGLGDDTLYGGGGFAWTSEHPLRLERSTTARMKFLSTSMIIWKVAMATISFTADMAMISRKAMTPAQTRSTEEQVTTHCSATPELNRLRRWSRRRGPD